MNEIDDFSASELQRKKQPESGIPHHHSSTRFCFKQKTREKNRDEEHSSVRWLTLRLLIIDFFSLLCELDAQFVCFLFA